jgi:hypothetical protein
MMSSRVSPPSCLLKELFQPVLGDSGLAIPLRPIGNLVAGCSEHGG